MRPQPMSRASYNVAGKKKLEMIQFKGFYFDFQTVKFKKNYKIDQIDKPAFKP